MAQKPALYVGSEIYERAAFGQNHPLAFMRQGYVMQLCRQLDWLSEDNFRKSPTADIETILRYHDPDYVNALLRADRAGQATAEDRRLYNFGTMENPLFKGVFERAATTVAGSILAAELALQGHTVFHPSGGTHHGMRDKAHGFCYFNDPAFSIFSFLDAGLERILYVDIDAHHGDGVESAFAHDDRVHCLSVHEENRWPYSGTLNEQRPGVFNIPVPQGISDSEFDYIFSHLVDPFCKTFDPQAVVITCGADALAGDPLSKMQLSNVALWDAVLKLRDMSDHCVVLGGGGYNPWTTVRCWTGLWGQLAGFEFPDRLPQSALDLLAGFESDLIEDEDRDPVWTTQLQDAAKYDNVVRDGVIERVETLARRLA